MTITDSQNPVFYSIDEAFAYTKKLDDIPNFKKFMFHVSASSSGSVLPLEAAATKFL
jgi:hypothetical protein